ncbi:MAG: phosphatidate cytidylyltransferase [Chloracidobacterium sp.]|nr:phosphatidate cytidylyltransferase [Chloracidobacterium sp.]
MARVLSAVVFLPILFSALWLGGPIWFSAIAAAGVLIGLYEYYRLASSGGEAQGLAAAAATLAAFYFEQRELILAIIAALVILELLVQLFIRSKDENFSEALPVAAKRVFGVLYLAVLGGYIIALRVIESPVIPRLAPKLLTLFFIVVFAGDTGAYYSGRAMGRKRLAPRVSPGKTVEGAIGGLLGNVAAALIAHFTFFPELKIVYGVPLVLVMGALGITGDLCESMLKRGARTKDAGGLIPGHGGLLDRLDSMLFNAPLLYYFYRIFLN